MPDAGLEEAEGEVLQFPLVLAGQGDGVSVRWQAPGGTLAGRVDELCCLDAVGEVNPGDAIVGKNVRALRRDCFRYRISNAYGSLFFKTQKAQTPQAGGSSSERP